MKKANQNSDVQISSKVELEDFLKNEFEKEQVYTIALFDILGFSNFVKDNRIQQVRNFYQRLVDVVEKQNSMNETTSGAGDIVPVPISKDWKSSVYILNGQGFVNTAHFSDTFILYMSYNLKRRDGLWTGTEKKETYPLLFGEAGDFYSPIFFERHHLYLSFLQTCMEFFCQAIIAGIPLRGCISTGLAVMNPYKSIFLGVPLVEAARGEKLQNTIVVAFGKSFNNSHPVYNDYFIPYVAHIKDMPYKDTLSPMVLDWARYWRKHFNEIEFKDCISKMNTNPSYSTYYDNAIHFFDFSAMHEDWSNKINRAGIKDILDFYKRTEDWYNSTVN